MSGNSKKRSIFSNPSVAYIIIVLFILVTSVFFLIGNIHNQSVSDSEAAARENTEKIRAEKQIADNIKATKNFTKQHTENRDTDTPSTENDNAGTASQGTQSTGQTAINTEAPDETSSNTHTNTNTKTNTQTSDKANTAGSTATQIKPADTQPSGTSSGKRSSKITSIITNKLLPANIEDKSSKQIETWTGWIIDRDCIGVNPLKHTAACNLMGADDSPPSSCYASGLGLLQYIPGKAYTSYNTFDQLYMFDDSSRTIVKVFIESLPANWINNITVKITGYSIDNIPVNKDETNFPEVNPSKVDHYQKGIHINKIEAAYIDGVSTNVLPVPNLVLPK